MKKNTQVFLACLIVFSLLFMSHDLIKEHVQLNGPRMLEYCLSGAIAAGLFVLLLNWLNRKK